MKKILYILTIFLISLTGCKNTNTSDGSNGSFDSNVEPEMETPIYNSEISDNYGEVTYHNMSGDSLLLVSERMLTDNLPNSRIKIAEYLGKMRFDSEANLLSLPSGNEVLFLHFYSGGAHCCSVIQAFIYNDRLKAFELLDSYGYDGDMVELIYPFDVSNRIEYFYCCYAAGQDFDCYSSDYSQKLYFENNKFLFKASGSKEILVRCYLNFLQTNQIPELSNGEDLGEREKVANFFLKYYSLDPNLETVFNLFNTFFPQTSDKAKLWVDLVDRLIPEDERTSEISRQILGFNSRITSIVRFNSPIQPRRNTSIEPELENLSCDELTELVQNEGNRIDNLSPSELDSEMLYNVDLYEYKDTYYIIADFQRGGTYIYCDINMGAWSSFKDNDYNSYGRSFHAYIAKAFRCNCN